MKAIRNAEINSVNESIQGKTASREKLKFRQTQHGKFLHWLWHRLLAIHTFFKNVFLLLMVPHFPASLINK